MSYREFVSVEHRNVNRPDDSWTLLRFSPNSRRALWLVRIGMVRWITLTVMEEHGGEFLDPLDGIGIVRKNYDQCIG